MNLPARQARKVDMFALALLGSVLLTVALALNAPARAQVASPTAGAVITSTLAVTNTVALTVTPSISLTAVITIPTASPISATKAITPAGNITSTTLPAQPQTPSLSSAPPSDVVPDSSSTDVVAPANALTPTFVKLPNTPVSGNSGEPLGSWVVTVILGIILLAVAWGAYQFLRKPPDAAVESAAVDSVAPTEAKAVVVAPLTNEEAAVEQAVAADEQPANVTCSNCGTVNPWSELHCTNCGVSLAGDKNKALDEGVAAVALAPAAVVAATPPPVSAAPPTTRPLDLPDDQLPYLETLSRADEQLEYVLDRTYITIGRARTNDIVIDNSFVGWQTVSPFHAELRYQDGKFVLVDKQSDNGSFVNRVRTGSNLLEDGMSLSFGKVEFIYRQSGKGGI